MRGVSEELFFSIKLRYIGLSLTLTGNITFSASIEHLGRKNVSLEG